MRAVARLRVPQGCGGRALPSASPSSAGSQAASSTSTYVFMQLLVQRGFVVVAALHLQPRHEGFDGEALERQEKARERLGGQGGAWLGHGEQKQHEVTGNSGCASRVCPYQPDPLRPGPGRWSCVPAGSDHVVPPQFPFS